MDISYNELKSKEIINLSDGRKLGRVSDILFDGSSGKVNGIIVPGEKKMFRKSDDIFVPLEKIRKIGDDVILIRIENNVYFEQSKSGYYAQRTIERVNLNGGKQQVQPSFENSYIRFRRLDNKKYK